MTQAAAVRAAAVAAAVAAASIGARPARAGGGSAPHRDATAGGKAAPAAAATADRHAGGGAGNVSKARGGDDTIGILHFETSGISHAAAAKFESGLVDALAGTGFHVMPAKALSEVLVRSRYTEGCVFGPCLAEVYRAAHVRLVLVARISGMGPSYSFVLSLVDTRTGVPTSQVAQQCAVCTVDEAISTATLAAVSLVTGEGGAKLADPKLGPAPIGREGGLAEDIARLRRRSKHSRALALTVAGAAVVAGIAGGILLARGDDSIGYPAAAAGGALALAGGALLIITF